MMRRAPVVACAIATLCCGDREVALGFPPEILDGSFESAVWLLQAGEAPSAPVRHAELVNLPHLGRWRLEFEAGDRVRLIAYQRHPEDLPAEFGALPSASGRGRTARSSTLRSRSAPTKRTEVQSKSTG